MNFKKGDKVRHKYKNQGRLTVIGVAAYYNMVHCVDDEGHRGDYFFENLELDKSAIINDILKQI